jgi:hypothetical protein
MYVADGEQRFAEIQFPREVRAGERFTVQNVRIENRGTEDMSEAEIAWDLVRERDPEEEGYSLGISSHPSLDAEEAWEGLVHLAVPRGVPAGEYYLRARVQDEQDESPSLSSWPGSNNVAFSRLALRVQSR